MKKVIQAMQDTASIVMDILSGVRTSDERILAV